jgi:hypothetical protein
MDPFIVKVEKSESVFALKEAIKDKKKDVFHNVDADILQILEVSIAVNDINLILNLNEVRLDDDIWLQPAQQLQQVFLDPPVPKHVHILVMHPQSRTAM